MAARSRLVAFALVLGCQPQAVGPPTAETLEPSDDGGAFAIGFPSSAGGGSADPPAEAASEPSVPDVEDAAGPAEGAAGSDPDSSSAWDALAPDGESAVGARPDGACASGPSPGDLVIDELMIESVAGAGDDGEWLEARSTLGCTVNLAGLHGECARGAALVTFDVTSDFWVPPGGYFLVADSALPAIDHYLPAPVVSWAGRQGDVLRNKGSTVSLRMSDVIIDTITYPALKLEVGTSWAFPSDCDPSLRGDFGKWQPSTSSWFPGFYGTPNADNDDVHCP